MANSRALQMEMSFFYCGWNLTRKSKQMYHTMEEGFGNAYGSSAGSSWPVTLSLAMMQQLLQEGQSLDEVKVCLTSHSSSNARLGGKLADAKRIASRHRLTFQESFDS